MDPQQINDILATIKNCPGFRFPDEKWINMQDPYAVYETTMRYNQTFTSAINSLTTHRDSTELQDCISHMTVCLKKLAGPQSDATGHNFMVGWMDYFNMAVVIPLNDSIRQMNTNIPAGERKIAELIFIVPQKFPEKSVSGGSWCRIA